MRPATGTYAGGLLKLLMGAHSACSFHIYFMCLVALRPVCSQRFLCFPSPHVMWLSRVFICAQADGGWRASWFLPPSYTPVPDALRHTGTVVQLHLQQHKHHAHDLDSGSVSVRLMSLKQMLTWQTMTCFNDVSLLKAAIRSHKIDKRRFSFQMILFYVKEMSLQIYCEP